MRLVFVLFDSLNRLALGAYGGTAVQTPNFDRFAKKSVTFDNHYVGSLPCIPARRDMHNGRLNFMHRTWGPLEPFDDSFARTLSRNGVYTHLISDHLHYFEDGGAGYPSAFDSWDYIRGQEYDALKVMVAPPVERIREKFDARHYPTDGIEPGDTVTRFSVDKTTWKRSRAAITHDFLAEEEDFPTAKCFSAAFDFLETNKQSDDWFLQLECFDPHEPFVVPARFKSAYTAGYNGKILDWPVYETVTNSAEEIAEIRANYAALVAMCDEYFGKLLDYFDENDLWKDTCLVLSTDHGFLLSEHEWWGKNRMPYYEEISHIPLMISHPEHQAKNGERRSALTQTPDLMPTFLDVFDCRVPSGVTGASLLPVMESDAPVREQIVFGMFAGPVGVTDGKYSYFRYPVEDDPSNLSMYTLMPAHMTEQFDLTELQSAELVNGFDFTKGAKLLKVPLCPKRTQVGMDGLTLSGFETALFDLDVDPGQENPITDAAVEQRMVDTIRAQFALHEAPVELYTYFGIGHPSTVREAGDTVAALSQ